MDAAGIGREPADGLGGIPVLGERIRTQIADQLLLVASGHDLDLGDVDYMDSTGLRAVLAARTDLEGRGARLDVVRASSIVGRLLEITGLGEMVTGPAVDEPPSA